MFRLFAIVALAGAAASSEAQVRAPARPQPAASSQAVILASGWTSLAAGRTQEAVRAADTVLALVPWSHPAIALKLEALASASAPGALDAYEQWLGPRADDVGLIEPIAKGILWEIARGSDPDLARDALRALVQARIDGAQAALAAIPSATGNLMVDAEAARGGDAAALKRLAAAAGAEVSDKSAIANALVAAGPAAIALLLPMLDERSGPTRAAAAGALGKLRAADATAQLRKALQDPDPYVRSSASVALARLGDADGQNRVQKMLESEVPDVQLMAAEAWDGQTGPWISLITPLLQNPDGLTRLHAARLIAPFNPEGARAVLGTALQDPNPVIRAASSEILADQPLAQPVSGDLGVLRRLLRDRDGMVRVRAAALLMSMVRSGR